MAVERVDPHEVITEAAVALGITPSLDGVMSPEGMAASLRRAASFLCPTAPGPLVRAVAEVLFGLPGFGEETRSEIERLVEALVSYGDLIELPVDDDRRSRRQVFLGPPAFVRRSSNAGLLIGVRPEGAPLISTDLMEGIEYRGHARLIRSAAGRPIEDLLESEGLTEVQSAQWLNAPRDATPHEVLEFYLSRLEVAGPAGDIDNVRLIDTATRVTYYSGRWRVPKRGDAGRFVARRPQAFGADLWCFADVRGGEITKLVDLPLQSALALGADEAWRLQAALDAIAGHPQLVRVRKEAETAAIDLFSPVPSWIQRRLDVVGMPMPRSTGALISYSLPVAEVTEEIGFLEQMMWLTVERVGDDG